MTHRIKVQLAPNMVGSMSTDDPKQYDQWLQQLADQGYAMVDVSPSEHGLTVPIYAHVTSRLEYVMPELAALLRNPQFAMEPTLDKWVRSDIKEALHRWATGSNPFLGGFLSAVVSGNLHEAVGRADTYNLHTLPAIVAWLHNHAPSLCWGTPERMQAWSQAAKERN